MRLLAIDDLVLTDVDFGTAATHPLITNRSERLGFGTRRRDGAAGSVFVRGVPDPARWHVLVKCPDDEARDTVMAALAGDLETERRLLAQRLDAAQTVVTARAAVVKVTQINDLDLSVDLESSDSVWTAEAVIETSKTFNVAGDRSLAVEVPGSARAYPILTFDPQAQRASDTQYAGWRYRRRATITNDSDAPWFRYPVRIALGDTTPLTPSKALAGGDDVRVWLAGIEQPRTLVTWDTASSFVWVIVPALPPGESLVYDIVYGNPSAAIPPTLIYPDLPAFSIADSNNGLWVYPVERIAGNAGRGLWHLSRSTWPATPDYNVPGAWRPLRTLVNPDNPDAGYVLHQDFVSPGSNTWAAPEIWREQGDDPSDFAEIYGNDYDAVAISNPLPIESITANWQIDDPNSIGRLVYLCRASAADEWEPFYENTTGGTTTITPGAQALPSGMHHLACANWPDAGWQIEETTSNDFREIRTNTVFSLLIDDDDLSISVGSEEEIYELADAVRVGGGESRVAPYDELAIGNAHQGTGAGTPRAAMRLTDLLTVDCDERTARVFDAAGVYVEDLPVAAVTHLHGWASGGGDGTRSPSSAWLPLSPVEALVPNAVFGIDIAGWEADTTTAGLTVARTWESAQGGDANGSYEIEITANTGGTNARARSLSQFSYPVNGRTSVWFGAWVRSGADTGLSPGLYVAFYDAAGVLIARDESAVMTVAATTEYRIVHGADVPPGAASYKIGLLVNSAASGDLGSTFFDDLRVNGSEVQLVEEALGSMALTVGVRGGYLV